MLNLWGELTKKQLTMLCSVRFILSVLYLLEGETGRAAGEPCEAM